MEHSEESHRFALVFEGTQDPSPSTLQKVKAVFLADLELPIEKIQSILAELPSVVMGARSKNELKPAYQKLKIAGAKVSIQDLSSEPESTESSEGDEMSFEFTLDGEDLTAKKKKHSGNAKVYALEVGEEGEKSLEEIEAQILQEIEGPSPSAPKESFSPGPASSPATSSERMNPGEEASFSLLSEDELKEFHQKRGASIESHRPVFDLDALASLNEELGAVDLGPETSTDDILASPVLEPASIPEETLDSAIPVLDIEAFPEGEEIIPTLLSPEPSSSPAPATALTESEKSPVTELALDEVSPLIEAAPVPAAEPMSSHAVTPVSFEMVLDQESPAQEPPAASQPPPPPHEQPSSGVALEFETPEKAPPPLIEKIEEKTSAKNPIAAPPPVQATPEPALPPEEAHASESVEISEEPYQSFQKAGAKPKRSKMPYGLDLAIPIIIGAVILGVANWFYFSMPVEEPAGLLAGGDESLGLGQISSASTQPVTVPKKIFSARKGDIIFQIELTEEKDAFTTAAISAETPPPPELTKEEIVRNVVRPPWMKRFEAPSLKLSRGEDGSYTAQGTSIAYLEIKGRPMRLSSETQFNMQILEDGATLRATLQSLSLDAQIGESSGITITSDEEGHFFFVLKEEFEATRRENQ